MAMNRFNIDTSIHSDCIPLPPSPLSPGSPDYVEGFAEPKNKESHKSSTKSTILLTARHGDSSNLSMSTHSSRTNTTTDETTSEFSLSTDVSRSRRVRFYERVRVKDTISHHDMSPKEHIDCWFQEHEYNAIDDHIDETIEVIEENLKKCGSRRNNRRKSLLQSIQKGDVCLRGLEMHLEHNHRRRRSLRNKALENVFMEQEDQLYDGIYDEESISRAYSEISRKCRIRAEIRALRDRREIMDYLFEGLNLSIHSSNTPDLNHRFEMFGVERKAKRSSTDKRVSRKRRSSQSCGNHMLKRCLKSELKTSFRSDLPNWINKSLQWCKLYKFGGSVLIDLQGPLMRL